MSSAFVKVKVCLYQYKLNINEQPADLGATLWVCVLSRVCLQMYLFTWTI